MKTLFGMLTLWLITSCSTTRIVDSWKNNDYTNYSPKKVLVIGLTENLTARTLFEEQLTNELVKRNIQALESYNIFEHKFTNAKQTEEDINEQVHKLSKQGFDAILISAVKGVDEKVSYHDNSYGGIYYGRPFRHYYYISQDIYFDRGYYDKYKVYHVEASLFNLKEEGDKSLVWVASYNIVDPNEIKSTVSNYVDAIIKSLEKEQLIVKK